MTLNSDPLLEYQRHVIDAVLGIFDGQSITQSSFIRKYKLLTPDSAGERVALIAEDGIGKI